MARTGKKSSVRVASSNLTALPARGHRVGWIVGMCESGWLVQSAPDATPRQARTTMTLDRAAMHDAASSRREALIVFENESPDLPIVIGLLSPPPREQALAVPSAEPAETCDVLADRQRMTLEARDQARRCDCGRAPGVHSLGDEIVLRCGESSITLRRNGQVIIRGTYVETRSAGVNRIKGGSVRIN